MKINPKYTHFAVSNLTGKIVNGWETLSDVETLKYYAKMDLKDMDLNPKEYPIMSAKRLYAEGVNPYNPNNWQ
jgi:hypothetical protein